MSWALSDTIKIELSARTGGGFLFDGRSGDAYTVNATGAYILAAMQEQRDEEEILGGLVERFAVDERQAREDLGEFLEALREHGVLR